MARLIVLACSTTPCHYAARLNSGVRRDRNLSCYTRMRTRKMEGFRPGQAKVQRSSTWFAIAAAIPVLLFGKPVLSQSGQGDFISTCSVEYLKRKPDESAVAISRWCECIDDALDQDVKIDLQNLQWLSTFDPSSRQDRRRVTRILNLRPEDMQGEPTPAVKAALQTFKHRVEVYSSDATAQCLSDPNHKNGQ